MLHSERLNLPRYIYPVDEWRLVEKRFHPDYLAQTETLFSTANGYLGMRGNLEEGTPAFRHGTYVNGFFESRPIIYGEEAHGFAKTGQTIVDVPDAKLIKLYVDDEPFYLPTAHLLAFERALNMKAGTLDREILWEMPSGKRVSIRSRRLASFEHRHLAAIRYQVTVLDADAPVTISSEIVNHEHDLTDAGDPRLAQGFREPVLLPGSRAARDHGLVLGYITKNSVQALSVGVDHLLETECPHTTETTCSDDSGKFAFTIDARAGAPVTLTKYVTYHTSRRSPPEELCERAARTLDGALGRGFPDLLASQERRLAEFWERSDIRIEGDSAVQQAVRFNLFQVFQASARAEGTGIPAKGLTGPGYEGHYFWDIEIYVLPFLIYTAPRIARNLLKFRYSYLDKARARARQVNQDGALFPWRTISGEEASAYYAAGTAQYHINADIAYALKKYVDVTGDDEFLYDYGAEILVETARLWLDLGFFSERQDGRFCIHGVTGPDEYNTVVNNNTYTNLMARENLWYAASTVETLRHRHLEKYEALVHRTRLRDEEIVQWREAADRMYVPFDEELGIHLQDDSFLDKERWDFDNTPEERYPLLLHFHPLVIYRHQVIKQADVVLAMFLLGHEFDEEQKRRNFDFYDPLTTGDSSLSSAIQAVLAAEVGYRETARQYAVYSALMDLADVGGNVKDGCHIASMGGTWMAIVYGLAGLRDSNGEIGFRPLAPTRLDSIRFPLQVRGQRLEVDISRQAVTYTLASGDELAFRHHDEEIRLTPERPRVERPLTPPPVS
jgi:alpha,alpha-trehalose phosphorylase